MPVPGDTAVRLTERERAAVARGVDRACREVGSGWRRILLFGSRVEPTGKGGDIDLLVELAPPGADTFRLELRMRVALEDELGERKIDLVFDDGGAVGPFVSLVRDRAVVLWTND